MEKKKNGILDTEPVFTDSITGDSGEMQKQLLDNLPCGAALYEYDGNRISVLHINKRYWQLVGRGPTDYSDTSVLDAIHPEDKTPVMQEIGAAIRQHRDAAIDMRIMCGAGGYKPFKVAANISPEPDGKYKFFVSYTSVSEQVMSMKEMIPIALSTVMSASGDLAYLKDRDSRYVCCSASAAQMLGLASERDIIGKTDSDLFDKELADGFIADDKIIIESGKSIVEKNEKIQSKHGRLCLAVTSKFPIIDTDGKVIGIYGTSRDVTGEKKADFELNNLLNVIPSGILKYSADSEEQFAYVSKNLIENLGYTQEQFRKKFNNRFCNMVYSKDRDETEANVVRQENNGQIGKFDYRIEAADGSLRWFHDEGIKITDHEGKSWYYVTLVDITEKRVIEEGLRVSEEENRLALEHSGNIITRFDVHKRTLTLPASFNEIFVLPPILNNVPEEQIKLGRISPETADAYTELFESILRGSASGSASFQQSSSEGWRWLKAQYTTVFSDSGEPVSAVISFSDITEQLEKEVVYNKWQQSLDERREDSYTLFRCNLSRDASYDSWDGKLLSVDFASGEKSFGERTGEYVSQCVYDEDKELYIAFLNADTLLANYYRGIRSSTLEYREQMPDGKIRWLRLSVDLVEYPNSRDIEAYLMYENIDERKQAELLALKRSETDPLTGALNREAFVSRMTQIISTSRPDENHALYMLDIDNFKHVNDSLGHAAGDEVLQNLTIRLRAILRRSDLIGRFGGDEFCVFLKSIPGEAIAKTKAHQIISLDIRPAGSESPVTTSCGVVMIPSGGTDFEILYKKADAALYKVKEHGKNNFCFSHD
ncbi:MAG: diguanylate cyclase [Clostridiales bacterium]|nr:diguanylate cyclase [Clostridiales bacterium]